MLKLERQEQILQLLKERRYCTVSHLAKALFVANITVRRDLEEMEKNGLLQRCHGGAMLPDHENREIPFEVRDRENSLAKDRIARKAAELIHDGDTVFLDASSTASHIIDHIHGKQNLTIITNSIRVLEKLRGQKVRCYLTGGVLLENSHALVGKIAEETVTDLYADVCFFSSQGITEDGVVTDFSEDETRLRKCMIKNAKKSYFLYDQSKLGKRFLFTVCDMDSLSGTITNEKQP